MNKQDLWLDERIRRGLNTWLPDVPDHLDGDVEQRSLSMRAEPLRASGKRRYTMPAVLAASLILGILALRLLGPKEDEPLSGMNVLPRPAHLLLTAIPGQFAPLAPLPDFEKSALPGSAGKIGRVKKVGSPSTSAAASTLQQIDLQLEIPGKNITIVWCQRSDFDLFLSSGRDGR